MQTWQEADALVVRALGATSAGATHALICCWVDSAQHGEGEFTVHGAPGGINYETGIVRFAYQGKRADGVPIFARYVSFKQFDVFNDIDSALESRA